MALVLQRLARGARARARDALLRPPPRGDVLLFLTPRRRRRLALLLRRQLDACAPCLGEADGNRLLRRARAVLALAHVVDLFADELARLCARRLALPLVARRAS